MVSGLKEIISILLLLSSLALPGCIPSAPKATEPLQVQEITLEPKWQVSDAKLTGGNFLGMGESIERVKSLGNHLVIPFVDTYGPDQLYCITRFWFFDKETGESSFTEWDYALTQWLFDESSEKYYIAGAQEILGGTDTYKENTLFCFDKNGKEIWRQTIDGLVDELLLMHDSLYIRITTGIDEDGVRSVLRINALNGKIIDFQKFGSQMISWMIPFEDTVKICSYERDTMKVLIRNYHDTESIPFKNQPMGVKYGPYPSNPVIQEDFIYFYARYFKQPIGCIMKMGDTAEEIITFKDDYTKNKELFSYLFGYKDFLFVLRSPFLATADTNYVIIDCYDLNGTFLSTSKVILNAKLQDNWYELAWLDGDNICLWVDDSDYSTPSYSYFEIPTDQLFTK